MATVAPASPARSKADARVQAEIDRAVGRIRANDLLLGGLAAAVLLLGFTTGMVLLDARFELPMAARQAALGGFALALLGVGYFFGLRPFLRAVNPRFAARRVEETVAGSKNAVINWVDLRDRDLPPTVRAAVGQSAAGNLQSADVAKATEAKPVAWLGAAAGLLAAGLLVMFLVLRPAPFVSLVKRTFSPFVVREIATRTTLTLTEPAGGDAAVTAGESLTVAVDVGGSVPAADGPAKLRVQVWHADAAEPDDLALEPGPGSDWRLTLPPSVIQNGFQYRVVGGDARTGDFTVTVRSRPLVTGFEARYESPAYTRIPVEVGKEAKLEGYRGTKVTLTARTNRQLKRGSLKLDGKPDPLPATVDGEAMRFELTLTESDTYRLSFTSTSDEVGETPAFAVKVLTDQPPTLTILKPAEDEVTLPANGTLAIDGEAADDFGLAGVTLKMRVVAPYPVGLKDRPYRGGKEFRRADGTYPARLADADGSQTGYRETVPLASLIDTSGKPLPASPETVIEYWLEATDNCTVPRANVGQTARKKLRLTPAVTEPAKKQEQDKATAQRQADQQKHEQVQDKQLQAEKRDPKKLRPEENPPQGGDPGQPVEPQQGGDQPKPEGSPEQGTGKPQPGKNPDGSKPTDPPQGGNTPPDQTPDGSKPPAGQPPEKPGDQQPKAGDPTGKPNPGGNTGKPEAGAKREPSAEDKKLDEQASKLQEAMRGQDGGGKPETAPAPTPADRAAEKDRQKGIQQAIDDLNGSDPGKQQAARDKLDKELSKEKREQIEKIQKGLKSDDPKEREEARKEMGELDRETGASSAGVRGDRREDVERLSRELNSEDQGTRENAEKQADKQLGQQSREQLKQTGKKLNSPEKPKQEEAKKEVDELVKKQKNKPQDQPSGGDGKPSPEQVQQQANDLTSPDKDKREAAEQAMDRQMGKPAREDLQKKLGSQDEKQQQAGKEQVEKMAQQAGGGSEKKPTPEQVKELADAARDLNSTDDAKRQTAEQKLDRQVGKENRETLQQLSKDLQSKDDKTRQAAERQVKDAAEKLAGGKKSGAPKPPTKEEIEQAAEAAKDLTSPDQAKRVAAEKQLDKQLGEKGRKELQEKLKADQAEDAAQKAEAAVKEQAAKDGKPQPSPEQMKDLADAAKDLTSSDQAKREAAEKKLDGAIGKENREKFQKEQATQQPDPKATKEAAEQAVKDAKQAEQAMKDLAETAQDLTARDEAKRKAAEQKLDQKIGKPAREQMQKLQQDLQSDDKQKREAAEKQVKDALDKLKGQFDPKRKWQPGGGGDSDTPGKRFEDDPASRLRSAELQLTDFKKARGNKELLGKAGFTPEEFERFYAEYEKRVEQLRAEVKTPRPDGDKPAAGQATVTVGGADKVEKTDGGPTTGGANTGKPTPGYTDAQKRFAAGAAKGGQKPAEAPKKP